MINKLSSYINLAHDNFQDNEFHYVIFHNEVDEYVEQLEKLGDQKLIKLLRQFHAYNHLNNKMLVENSVENVMTTRDEDIELFEKDTKFAHLNLHYGLGKDKKDIKFIKRISWTFPSLALFRNNTPLFNNLVFKYKPLLGMIFKLEKTNFRDKKDREYASKLQALIQHSSDLDLLFNALERHPSLFRFKEVYYLIKNSIVRGTPQELKILNSKTMKSWFNFINEESRIKVRQFTQ